MQTKPQQNEQSSKLQQILKRSLQQCITLARKKIRSKKGLSDLQQLLIDYHKNAQLAEIIYKVIKLILLFETSRKQEVDQNKQAISVDQYNHLQQALQKHQSSVREHIKNQQQLKIYCDNIQQKNQQLEKSNQELMKSTKLIITNLKRENQKLIQQNINLMYKLKEKELKESSDNKEKEQGIINSIKKARKLTESNNSNSNRNDNDKLDKFEGTPKRRTSSISSIRIFK